MKRFLEWMKKSATDEKAAAAKEAKTSVMTLRLLAYEMEGKPHGRVASSDLAARIEEGIEKINSRPRYKALPSVTRADLNPTCRECKYFKACKEET